MTTSTSLERLGYGGPTGVVARGHHRIIIPSGGATRTLLAKESGALCLLDASTGVQYTLPTPIEGMQFEFFATVSVVASATYKVITGVIASQFILGEVLMYTTATASPAGFACNGTNIVAITQNGSTTGGLIGTRFVLTAVSSTIWTISGALVGSGSIATPAATS